VCLSKLAGVGQGGNGPLQVWLPLDNWWLPDLSVEESVVDFVSMSDGFVDPGLSTHSTALCICVSLLCPRDTSVHDMCVFSPAGSGGGDGDSWDVPSSPEQPPGGGVGGAELAIVAVVVDDAIAELAPVPRGRGRPKKAPGPLSAVVAVPGPPSPSSDPINVLRPGVGNHTQQLVVRSCQREAKDWNLYIRGEGVGSRFPFGVLTHFWTRSKHVVLLVHRGFVHQSVKSPTLCLSPDPKNDSTK
jgi:hypothetical protein